LCAVKDEFRLHVFVVLPRSRRSMSLHSPTRRQGGRPSFTRHAFELRATKQRPSRSTRAELDQPSGGVVFSWPGPRERSGPPPTVASFVSLACSRCTVGSRRVFRLASLVLLNAGERPMEYLLHKQNPTFRLVRTLSLWDVRNTSLVQPDGSFRRTNRQST
jgi:hypothetical protein